MRELGAICTAVANIVQPQAKINKKLDKLFVLKEESLQIKEVLKAVMEIKPRSCIFG